jgi:NitT/TauT family transport system ATP-binding protein
VVFQAPALLPWLTVAENVAFGLKFARAAPLSRLDRRRRVAEMLARVGLAADADRHPRALSGGMAQRVALARALVREPALIFLDEPFSALDALTREAMQDLLLALAQRQRSAVLMVTHDLDEALRIADRIVLLKGAPARLQGGWRPPGRAPRVHRSAALNALREEMLDALGEPAIPLRSVA